MLDQEALAAAIGQARKSYDEGGLPIGAALVLDGALAALGHNRREQNRDCVAHAELDCLRNAGPLPGASYRNAVLYSTLSPCWMCAGAARLYGIPRVVIADAGLDVPGQSLWRATPEFFQQAGIQYEVCEDQEMISLFREFLAHRPRQWEGDVGA